MQIKSNKIIVNTLTRQIALAMYDFNLESRFRILTKKLHIGLLSDFLIKQELRFWIFVSTLWCNILFLRFRCFASTMVALASFLSKSVPDGGKWGRYGKLRTTRFTCDHRKHVERSLTCFAMPCSATACMSWQHNCERVKRQNDVVIL